MSDSARDADRPPLTPDDERLWASVAHFGTVIGFLPPLLVLLLVGPRSRFVRQESREALNLAVTALLVWVALALLGRVCGVFQDGLPPGPDLPFVILVFLLGVAQLAVWLAVVVLSVAAGLRVQRGGGFRHPLPLRLVR